MSAPSEMSATADVKAPADAHPPLTSDVVTTGRLARRGQSLAPRVYRTVASTLHGIGVVSAHAWHRRNTIQYPEEMVYLPPRYRGRIVLSRDPAGEERCVACYLCAVACPVDCISLQATDGRARAPLPGVVPHQLLALHLLRLLRGRMPHLRHPAHARRGDERVRRADMVYEKEDLLIWGPGKYHDYDFYRVAGLAIGGKDKGEAENEAPPGTSRSPALMTGLWT